jgi:hypothetical protein
MTDRALAPRSLAAADARCIARGASWLCLPALLCAALLWLTLPAAGFTQGNVPKLTAGDPIGLAEQGFSVAISADGTTAIVGGPFDNSGTGAAWIFTQSGGTWTEQQKLIAADANGAAQLGWSVALSDDGNTAIVGGPGDNGAIGAAWVFTRSGSVWSQVGAKLSGAGATGANCALPGVVGSAELGYAVALSGDGNTAIVGGWADNSALGAAWVFTRSGGAWSQSVVKLCGSGATDTTNIMQGFAVALSDDGTTAIVGGPNDGTNRAIGAAWVFTQSGGTWSQQGPKLVGATGLCAESQQGFAVALSGDGNTAIVGGPGDEVTNNVKFNCEKNVTQSTSNGAGWVFTRSGGVWSQQGDKLVGVLATTSSNPGQGFSVALAGDGNTALVGGPTDNANTGAAWVFTRSGGAWNPQGNALVGTGAGGAASQASSVALSRDGSTAIVGGPLDQGGTGAVWVFNSPSSQATLTVSVTGSGTVTSGPSGIACPSTCSADFGAGTNVNLTATPASGWSFSGWSGACSGSGSCTVTMSSSQAVTATFTQLFTLTVSEGGSGTVTSSPSGISCGLTCSASFAAGTPVTLAATPASGWSFVGWSGACSGSGSCVVTIGAAESVTASFAQPGEALNVSVSGSGTVTSSPSGIGCPSLCTMNFSSGSSVTLTATPGGGATFGGWSGACSGNGGCTVTMNSLQSVTAMFTSPVGSSSPTARTWVSAALGNDANPCSRSAPCLTFAAALALTTPGGEIDVLDPGDFGPLTITQSVTIEGDETSPSGVTLSAGASAVTVSAGAADVINLRGLSFNGGGVAGASGVVFNSGAGLNIANCAFASFAGSGVTFSPSAGSASVTKMDMHGTTIDGAGAGILIKPTGGIAARVVLRRVKLESNVGYGLDADGTGGSGTINVTITNSTVSLSGANGISAVSGPGSVAVSLQHVVVRSSGAAGVQSNQNNGGSASVSVGDSTISGNAVGLSAVGGGSLVSYGNNHLSGNATNGSFTGTSNLQ